MDKLKPIWKVIKKYHVWVLCMVIIAIGVGGLFAAGDGLETAAKTTSDDVKKMDSTIQRRVAQTNPPNEEWVKQKDAQITKEGTEVYDIWKTIYDWQEQQLQWPADVGGKPSAEFVVAIRKQAGQSRIEKVQEEAFEAYTTVAFDKLLAIVNAQPNYAAKAPEHDKAVPGARKKKAAVTSLPVVRSPYVIGWATTSQSRIRDPLVNWGDETEFKAPTTARVESTQRDLWIYGSLLNAIDKTNGSATANYMAKVKYILDIQVGKDVQSLQQRVAAAKTPKTPAKGRAKTKPKTTAKTPVRAAASRPRNSFRGIESVPVRMDLIVDQRYISTLFSELANASLPIEINSFVAQYHPKRNSLEKQQAPKTNRTADAGPSLTIVDSYDMRLVIEGKVNFYKAPDKQLLGTSRVAP